MVTEKSLIENYPVLVDLIDEIIENIDHIMATPDKVYIDKIKREQRRSVILSALFGTREEERKNKSPGPNIIPDEKAFEFLQLRMEEEKITFHAAVFKYHYKLEGSGAPTSKYRRLLRKSETLEENIKNKKDKNVSKSNNAVALCSYTDKNPFEEDLIKEDLKLIRNTLKKYSTYINEITKVN